jgi:dCMP deaminase
LTEDVKDALRSIQSISVLLLVSTATIGLIGLSPNRAERYARAAAALDSLPYYPCAIDTSTDDLARRFGESVGKVDSVLRQLDPMATPTMGPLSLSYEVRLGTHYRFKARQSSVSSDLIPFGARIKLAPDHSMPSLIAFLEAVRSVSRLAAPNFDSLYARAYPKLDSIAPPNRLLAIDFSLDPSDADGKWLLIQRVHVKVNAKEMALYRHIPSVPAVWQDSFTVAVPPDSTYFLAVRTLSWRMIPYFQRQTWLSNREWPTSVRWNDYSKLVVRPVGAAALAPVDRIKPVLLEIAEMELPAARRFLQERAEALRERGNVTILGLYLENSLAVWIVPLIFASLAVLILFHLLHARGAFPEALRTHAWAPAFADWTGTLSGSILFVGYPVAAVWFFIRRMAQIENGWAAIPLTAIAVGANIGSFAVLRGMRRRAVRAPTAPSQEISGMQEPRPSVEEYKMGLAVEVASRSNCMKSRVGAIILLGDRIRAVGYNGTIEDFDDCFDGGCPRCRDLTIATGEQLDRCICVHAEENALISAARYGIPVEDSECYVTHNPCVGCTKLLIQARIKLVVFLKEYEYPETRDHNRSRQEMRQAAVAAGKTVFKQFNDVVPASHAQSARERVKAWTERLDRMKEEALAYGREKGIVKEA